MVNSLNHLSKGPPLGLVILKNIGIGAINFNAPNLAALTPKSSENDKNKYAATTPAIVLYGNKYSLLSSAIPFFKSLSCIKL